MAEHPFRSTALFRFESFRRGLVASSGLNLVSQGVGFVVLVLFARYFGASQETDLYLYCVSMVAALSPLITCLNASVVIPETMRLWQRDSPQSGVRFFNCYLYGYLLTAAALVGVTVWDPVQVVGTFSAFDHGLIERYRPLLRWAAPMLLGEVAVTSLNDLLVSRRFFTAPMLSTMLNRLLQAIGLVTLQGYLGIYAMPIAVLTAYATQALALVLVLRSTSGWSPAFNPRLVRRQVVRNSAFGFAGSLMSCLAQLVPLYLLSGLGTGVVSAVNYATRILNIPQALLVNHAASVTGIRLNELAANAAPTTMAEVFLRASRGLVFVLTPLAAALFLLAQPLVVVLLERGSFDADVSAQVALFLRWLGLALPLLGINALVARLFMAAQLIRPAFVYQCVQNAFLLGLIVVGTELAEAPGYVAAFLAFHVWNVGLLRWLLKRFFPRVQYDRLLLHLLGMALVNAALAGCLTPLVGWATGSLRLPVVIGVSLLFACLLVLLQWRFELSPELRQLLECLRPAATQAPDPRSPPGPCPPPRQLDQS